MNFWIDARLCPAQLGSEVGLYEMLNHFPLDSLGLAGTIIGVGEEFKAFGPDGPSVANGPEPVVSNLFRIGIFTRCDSTKSTPSAVSIKSELSDRVM